MFYYIIALLVVLAGLLSLFYSSRLLLDGSWWRGFLRGCGGIVLVAVGAVAVLVALDILGYKHAYMDRPVATISFERLGEQSYRAVLVETDGTEQRYDILGDQWQMDARILRWNSLFASMGAQPAYRLDRLGGRYFSLEKERQANRSVYSLTEHETLGMDLWPLMQSASSWLPLSAQYGSATYMPMEDGALYSVSLTASGLIAKPMNEPAKAAIKRWQ